MPKKYHGHDFFEVCGSRPPARLLARLLSWESYAQERFSRNGHKWLVLTHEQLSYDMSVSPSTVARSIKRLETRGLIVLLKAPHPFRPSVLHCTWVRVQRDKLPNLETCEAKSLISANCTAQNSQNADFLPYTNKNNKIPKLMKGDEVDELEKNYEGVEEDKGKDVHEGVLGESDEPPATLSAKDLEKAFLRACETEGHTHKLSNPKIQEALLEAACKFSKEAHGDEKTALAAIKRFVVEFDAFLVWARNRGQLKNAKSKRPNVFWLNSQAKWILDFHRSRCDEDALDEESTTTVTMKPKTLFKGFS